MLHVRSIRFVAAAALAAVIGFAAPASAQQPRHIRGTLTEVTATQATVQTAAGKTEAVKLTEKSAVFIVAPADFSAITANKFVGITSVEKDGKRIAREVHVFAEALRGLAEGHYPWDLESDPNMMTNANIGKVEMVGTDRVLKLDFKGGEQTISIPSTAVVVSFEKATAGEMKVGAKVFIIATPADDAAGTSAIVVVVGAGGMKPPM